MTPEDNERIARYLYALNNAPLTAAEQRIADAEMIEAARVPGLHYGTPFLGLVLEVNNRTIPTTVRVDCTRCSKKHTFAIKYVTLIVRKKEEKRG